MTTPPSTAGAGDARSARRAGHPPAGGRHASPAMGGWLALALALLAAGLIALSPLGPLASGAVDYRITETIESQLLGLDAISLAFVAPLAALAALLVLRAHPLGPVLGIGPAVYVAYMIPQYVFGPDYLAIEGNNERLFPLMLALFVLGTVAAVACWTAIDLARLATSARSERLVGRVLLPIAAVLVFARYPFAIADWMSAEPSDTGYLAGPVFGWTIALLDLGIALPATVAVYIGMRRGVGWARKGLHAVVSWYALVGVAVAAMAITMFARDDPAMAGGQMAAMVGLGMLNVALALTLYAPLLRRPSAPGDAGRPPQPSAAGGP
jgi:hypothetical protein